MVTPVFTGIIFDSVIPGAQRATLAEFSVFLVISALATALFTLTRSLATLRLQTQNGGLDPSGRVGPPAGFAGALLPEFYFRRSGPAESGNQPNSRGAHGSALASILTGMFSITSCALMFYYSWRLALIAAALGILFLPGIYPLRLAASKNLARRVAIGRTHFRHDAAIH